MIHPCRNLCEKVYSDCKPLIDTFGIAWPEELECNRWGIFHVISSRGDIFQMYSDQAENWRQDVKNS